MRPGWPRYCGRTTGRAGYRWVRWSGPPTIRCCAKPNASSANIFAGARTAFDVPLSFAGSDFQQRVWRALLAIPFGETRSYGEMARQLGNPAASRAVGAANGRNPISIIAPCHRVVGSTGKLTGFAGGLDAKAYLLDLERQALGGRSAPDRMLRAATLM